MKNLGVVIMNHRFCYIESSKTMNRSFGHNMPPYDILELTDLLIEIHTIIETSIHLTNQ